MMKNKNSTLKHDFLNQKLQMMSQTQTNNIRLPDRKTILPYLWYKGGLILKNGVYVLHMWPIYIQR